MSLLRLCLFALLLGSLTGCVSGNNYPDSYASAYCGTIYACFEADSIEDNSDWDDISECRDEVAESIMDGSDYDSWEEGDATFDGDAAENCIDEVLEFRSDSDCSGDDWNIFTWAAFVIDVSHEDCGSVYDPED